MTPGKKEKERSVSIIVSTDSATLLPVVWRYHRWPWLWHMLRTASLEFQMAHNVQDSNSEAFLERPFIVHVSTLWGCLLSFLCDKKKLSCVDETSWWCKWVDGHRIDEKTQVNIKPQCTPNTYLEADRLAATSILPTLPCDAVTLMDTDVTYCSGWWDVQAAQGAKALLTCQGRSGRMPDFSLCISPGMQRKFTCSLWVFWSSNCKFSCCHNRDARDGNMVWPTQQVLQINLWAQISLELTPLTIMYLWAESPD